MSLVGMSKDRLIEVAVSVMNDVLFILFPAPSLAEDEVVVVVDDDLGILETED